MTSTNIASIYHNPRCSKSRQTLALLEQHNIAHDVILYLQSGLTRDEVMTLKAQLNVDNMIDFVRTGESEFKAAGLSRASSESQLVDALVSTPKLLERPIVIFNEQARIGRPPENVLALFEDTE